MIKRAQTAILSLMLGILVSPLLQAQSISIAKNSSDIYTVSFSGFTIESGRSYYSAQIDVNGEVVKSFHLSSPSYAYSFSQGDLKNGDLIHALVKNYRGSDVEKSGNASIGSSSKASKTQPNPKISITKNSADIYTVSLSGFVKEDDRSFYNSEIDVNGREVKSFHLSDDSYSYAFAKGDLRDGDQIDVIVKNFWGQDISKSHTVSLPVTTSTKTTTNSNHSNDNGGNTVVVVVVDDHSGSNTNHNVTPVNPNPSHKQTGEWSTEIYSKEKDDASAVDRCIDSMRDHGCFDEGGRASGKLQSGKSSGVASSWMNCKTIRNSAGEKTYVILQRVSGSNSILTVTEKSHDCLKEKFPISGQIKEMVNVHSNAVAFRTSEGKLYLVDNDSGKGIVAEVMTSAGNSYQQVQDIAVSGNAVVVDYGTGKFDLTQEKLDHRKVILQNEKVIH